MHLTGNSHRLSLVFVFATLIAWPWYGPWPLAAVLLALVANRYVRSG